jgi:hypothetical protein
MRIRLSQLRSIIAEEVRRVVAEGPTRTPEEEARFKEIQAALRGPAVGKSAAEVRADDEEIKKMWAALTPEERAEKNRSADKFDSSVAYVGGEEEPDNRRMEVEPGFGKGRGKNADPYGPYGPRGGRR